MDPALEGMDTMFHITTDSCRSEAGAGVSVVPAAVQAAVCRVVFSSVTDPSISELVNHSANARVEEAIVESGMVYERLQPTLFVQGVARSWQTSVKPECLLSRGLGRGASQKSLR
jgi:uncharacterized protein YbjT (DUF2867 family)